MTLAVVLILLGQIELHLLQLELLTDTHIPVCEEAEGSLKYKTHFTNISPQTTTICRNHKGYVTLSHASALK